MQSDPEGVDIDNSIRTLVALFFHALKRDETELLLKTELLNYRVMVQEHPAQEADAKESPNAPLGVWWSHPDTNAQTPTWRELFVKVATVQPSSCSVERLFSATKHVLSPFQLRSLPDIIRFNVVRYFNRDV